MRDVITLDDMRTVLSMLDRIQHAIDSDNGWGGSEPAVYAKPSEWKTFHRFASQVRFSAVVDS